MLDFSYSKFYLLYYTTDHLQNIYICTHLIFHFSIVNCSKQILDGCLIDHIKCEAGNNRQNCYTQKVYHLKHKIRKNDCELTFHECVHSNQRKQNFLTINPIDKWILLSELKMMTRVTIGYTIKKLFAILFRGNKYFDVSIRPINPSEKKNNNKERICKHFDESKCFNVLKVKNLNWKSSYRTSMLWNWCNYNPQYNNWPCHMQNCWENGIRC